MPAITDQEVQDAVMALREKGRTYEDIAKELRIAKSTVRNIVKRAKGEPIGCSKKKRKAKVDTVDTEVDTSIPARACAITDASVDTEVDTSDKRSALDDLTKQRTAEEMMEYLRITKDGYKQAKDSGQEADKRVWQEVQYLKLYREAIQMMINCTGLTKDAIEALPVSPVDSYLTGSLEVIKAKEEQTDGGSD